MNAEPSEPLRPRDEANWARAIDALKVRTMPLSAVNLNVEGRQLVGPLQGFGPLYRKRYRVRLEGVEASPESVIRIWRQRFASFWPKGNTFYAPISGIAPGEVAVLNLASPVGVQLSTGVMVIYADDTSFTFMNPEGHMFAAIITFSAYEEDGVTVVQVEPLLRANDPFWEVVMRVDGYKREDRFWTQTLTALAAHFGVTAEVVHEVECLDPRRQWSQARNIWHNAAIRSGLYAIAVRPARQIGRWVIRRRARDLR
ncbi:MAG TPA: hypothetical protein PKD46_02720 [Aggregatilineaceae bacterium]|mgnify:FL=1|nr:hypothetical protein [Anaerolineae bacterium]HMM27175.1 hypothetical protein [Aggregatilineaceae bacterium]